MTAAALTWFQIAILTTYSVAMSLGQVIFKLAGPSIQFRKLNQGATTRTCTELVLLGSPLALLRTCRALGLDPQFHAALPCLSIRRNCLLRHPDVGQFDFWRAPAPACARGNRPDTLRTCPSDGIIGTFGRRVRS